MPEPSASVYRTRHILILGVGVALQCSWDVKRRNADQRDYASSVSECDM